MNDYVLYQPSRCCGKSFSALEELTKQLEQGKKVVFMTKQGAELIDELKNYEFGTQTDDMTLDCIRYGLQGILGRDKSIAKKEYGVYSDFDIDMHAKTFTCYTEVIIHPSGKVEYAVPSHQQKLCKLLMNKYNVTYDDVMYKLCPRDRWIDIEDWLLEKTGCVCVWYDGFKGKPNRIQKKILNNFIEKGIMRGEKL